MHHVHQHQTRAGEEDSQSQGTSRSPMQPADRVQQLADRVLPGLGTTQDTSRNRRGNSHFTGRLWEQPQRDVLEGE